MTFMQRTVRQVRRSCIVNTTVVSGLAFALVVGVVLWVHGMLGPLVAGTTAKLNAGSFTIEASDLTDSAFDPKLCGSFGPSAWHLKYAELHHGILAGSEPQRYAVAHGFDGLSDSIVGAITVFWYALLTDRAFQMMPTNKDGQNLKYEWMYAQPFINWTQTEADDPDNLTLLLEAANISDTQWKDVLKRGNVSHIGEDKRTVKIVTNYGYSVGLFDNPYHRDQLFEMGLRPETAFGCAYDFLFYPQPQLFEEHQREYEVLMRPGPLKIGIQIRAGDWAMERQLAMDSYSHFFECASEIERDFRRDGQDVIWYLVTDNVSIRREAQEKFGDKLLASDPSLAATHILHEKGNTPSLRAAAMEQWLFGLADFHVLSRRSGYGRTGGWRSKKWHRMYTLESGKSETPRHCSAADWDSVKALAALGDGVVLGDYHPGI